MANERLNNICGGGAGLTAVDLTIPVDAWDKEDEGEAQGTQGINILLGTVTMDSWAHGRNPTFTKDGEYRIANLPKIAEGASEWQSDLRSLYGDFAAIRNQTVTLSMDIKCDGPEAYAAGTAGLQFAVYLRKKGTSGNAYHQQTNVFKTIVLTADWSRVRCVFDCHDAKFGTAPGYTGDYVIGDDAEFSVWVYNRSHASDLHVRKLKLEVGDVANPVWTPSPQDIKTGASHIAFIDAHGISMSSNAAFIANLLQSGAETDVQMRTDFGHIYRGLLIGEGKVAFIADTVPTADIRLQMIPVVTSGTVTEIIGLAR